jgi:solute carrier family 35 protein E1
MGKLGLFIFGWYAFNAGFNVTNKQILNQFNFAWIVSWLQLATGLGFVLPAWATGARRFPRIDSKIIRAFAPISLLHAGGHVLQVSAMGSGSVFFTHVIKASEPLVGVIVSFLATGARCRIHGVYPLRLRFLCAVQGNLARGTSTSRFCRSLEVLHTQP